MLELFEEATAGLLVGSGEELHHFDSPVGRLVHVRNPPWPVISTQDSIWEELLECTGLRVVHIESGRTQEGDQIRPAIRESFLWRSQVYKETRTSHRRVECRSVTCPVSRHEHRHQW